MASTIRIAILAQATAAQREFNDTAQSAQKAGRETEQAFAGVGDKAKREFSQIGDQAQKAGREIETEIKQGADDAGRSLSKIGDSAKEGLGKVGDFAKEAGKSLAAGLGIGVGLDIGGQLVAGITGALGKADIKAKLSASLGLEGEDAARAGKIAGDVYASNFGSSLEEVSNAVALVYKNIGEGSDQWAKDVTADVLTVTQVFDQDLGGTTRAVGQLLRTGLAKDAQSALDVLTRGFQLGADKADDLLDTINEYSTQFRKFGLDAQTATGLLVQGLQAGARDSDLVADAIKEFSIRAIDFTKKTASAFEALGLDWSKMNAAIAKGGPEAAAALDMTLDALRAIEDPAERSRIAVELFGTQAEDLGDALFALDPSTAVAALGQVEGAAKKAGETIGGTPLQKIEAFKRSLQDWSTTNIGNAIGQLGTLIQKIPSSVWDGIRGSVDSLKTSLNDMGGAWLEMAKAATGSSTGQEVLLKTLQVVRGTIDGLVVVVDGLVIAYQSSASAVYALVAGYKLLTGDVDGAREAWNRSTDAAKAAGDAAVKQADDVVKLKNNWVQGSKDIQKANQDAAAAAVIAAKSTGDAHDRGAKDSADAYTKAGATIGGVQTKIGSDGRTQAGIVSGAYAGAATGVSGNFTTMGVAGQRAATDASGAHKTAASQTSSYWQAVPGLIKGYFANASLSSAGNNVMNSFLNAAQSVWNNTIAPWLRARAAEIANLKGPPAKDRMLLRSAGRLVMEGFQTGLERGYEDVRRSLSDFTGTIAPDVRSSLDATSPVLQVPSSMKTAAPQVITIEPRLTGDRLMDLILQGIRYEVRAGGGSVQTVLGRA
jgi:phage-related minor tail protein